MPERYSPEEMDKFAEDASLELNALSNDATAGVEKVADWLQKWFMKAGYRRLGRLLREYRKITPTKED